MNPRNLKNKTFSILLAIVLTLVILPFTVPKASATEQRTAMLVGDNKADGIKSTDYIYFGNWANGGATEISPLRWLVLDTKTNMDGATEGDGLFVLSDVLLGDGSESGGVFYQKQYATFYNWYNDEGVYCGAYFKDLDHEYVLNEWQGSDAQKWCRDFSGQSGDQKEYTYSEFTNGVPTAFSVAEANAILSTYKTDKGYRSDEFDCPFGEWTDSWEKEPLDIVNILSGDKVFFLSAEEAETYFPKGYDGNEARLAEGAGDEIWWLRSPTSYDDVLAGLVRATGAIKSDDLGQVGYDWAARPAFNIDLKSVLFISAADNSGHNNSFSAPVNYTGNEWKLTLKDENDFSNNASVYGMTTLNLGYEATELTISHTALSSLSDNYTNVTATLTDSNGNLLYTGLINSDVFATNSTLTIPTGLETGTYTLSVYGEDRNGAKMTDYATGIPFTTEINVVCNHTYTDNSNGFCIDCGNCDEPTLNTNGYYEIGNAGQLYWFSEYVNDGNTSANAKLITNITVNKNVILNNLLNTDDTVIQSFRTWTPIGNNENKYCGDFDGQNFTVSGLYFNDNTTGYIALFGCLDSSGTVQNVGVINSYLSGDNYIGGVIGYNYGTVTNCYTNNIVSGTSKVGGLVGCNAKTVKNCYNTGALSGGYVGGVVGDNTADGTVNNCHNTGVITGNTGYTGGVVGNNSGGLIDCYNTGAVTTGFSSYTGGVAGNNSGNVRNCYNLGSVNGSSSVGGVVGYNNQGNVLNCYNLGNVNCEHDGAGIVGSNNGVLMNCYNKGAVSSERDKAGVVKYNYDTGSVQNCYFLKTETINADLNAIFENAGEAINVLEKSTAQFASGEIAYLLGSSWGQTLAEDNKDEYPVLGGAKVYFGFISCAENAVMVYTNNEFASAEKPAHDMADATCTNPSTCKNGCGRTEGTINENAHSWNNGEITTNSTCTTKGVITFTCQHDGTHTYTEDVAIDANAHTYDNACDATCNTCGEQRSPAEHINADKNNTCDECGAELPKDGLSGGAIAGIVVGCALVLFGGGFAVYWFMIKKKKRI